MIGWWLEQPPAKGVTTLPTTFSQSLYDVLMHQRNQAWRETLLARRRALCCRRRGAAFIR